MSAPARKKQLEGEAKFIRAWLHFHLVNYWGDVPYITTTDHRVNALQKRLPSADVYQRIILDLTEAQTLLSQSLAGNTERIRPDKWTATALLARVYLFFVSSEAAVKAFTRPDGSIQA